MQEFHPGRISTLAGRVESPDAAFQNKVLSYPSNDNCPVSHKTDSGFASEANS